MKALIFAAGRGERMRPLTDTVPKPLLEAGGRTLVEWHLERLAAIGVREAVLNTSWLARCFPEALGQERFGVRLHFIDEGPDALETGGGMLNALAWLGRDPFIAVNGDVWSDYDPGQLPDAPAGLAHLVLVDNPAHHPVGDFVLDADGRVREGKAARLTFAGIGVYRPALLDGWRSAFVDHPPARRQPPCFPLAPVLRRAMAGGQVRGSHHRGTWTDVGTPERLEQLRRSLA